MENLLKNLAFAGLAFVSVHTSATANGITQTKDVTQQGGGSVNVSVNVSSNATSGSQVQVNSQGADQNIGSQIQNRIQNFIGMRAAIISGTVMAVNSSNIIVDDNGTSITVDFNSGTHFRRRFWGVSNLSEISVGDKVDIVGRYMNNDKTTITAVLIRDLSVQRLMGVFFGDVQSLTNGGFVMTTIHRVNETVTSGAAKIIDRGGNTLVATQIQVGDRVRVRGTWDNTDNTITSVTEIKDFSVPAVPSFFASPTP